jgi:hypothetical protein
MFKSRMRGLNTQGNRVDAQDHVGDEVAGALLTV